MSSEVDWGADTASLKLIGEIMIQLFTLWMDAYSLKLIGEPMIQVSSFTLCTLILMQSQRISSPWGGLPQRTTSTPLMEHLNDSLDTGQIADGFSNSKSIKQYRSSYSPPDPEQHESSYNLLTEWDPVTENAQKGSLVDCQEDVPYTALTIVCTINVSIDCDCFDVSNPSTRKNIHKRKSSQ